MSREPIDRIESAHDEDKWNRLRNLSPLDQPQEERDAWFLKLYAEHVRKGTERTLEIPSILASVIDGIAKRILTRS